MDIACTTCGRHYPIPRSGRSRCLGCIARERATFRTIERTVAHKRRGTDRRVVDLERRDRLEQLVRLVVRDAETCGHQAEWAIQSYDEWTTPTEDIQFLSLALHDDDSASAEREPGDEWIVRIGGTSRPLNPDRPS